VRFANAELIPDILVRLPAALSEVKLEVQELTTFEQVRALRDGRLKVGILVSGVQDRALSVETIREEPLVVVLPERHPLLRERRVPLRPLAAESFILCPYRLNEHVYERILDLCRRAGFIPKVIEEASPKQTILGLVAAGFGVSLVAASIQQCGRTGVAYRPLRGINPTVEAAVARRKDEQSPILMVFPAVVREFMRPAAAVKRSAF
jgi:DNA-binding transcriptional LysR family regulator